MSELRKMVRPFGLEVVQAYMKHVQDNAEESVRRVLDRLQDGSFVNRLDGGITMQVSISVDREKREAVIDFTGTSPQNHGNYNASTAVCRAAVLYVFRSLVNDDIPLNEGCLKPLKIIIPPGSMISPTYPAAVISGNTEVSQAMTDTLFGALGVLAASRGTMNNFTYGNDEYQNYENHMRWNRCGTRSSGNQRGAQPYDEHENDGPGSFGVAFPIRLDSFSIRRGSGGRGRYDGGDGVIRKIRFLESMTVTILSSHRETAPYGLDGGSDGSRGRNYVVRADGTTVELGGNDEIDIGTLW